MHRLLREDIPIAQIARQLGVSRQTVYNWQNQEAEHTKRMRRPSKLDPFKPYIESRLERFDIPATVLMKEIKDQIQAVWGPTHLPLSWINFCMIKS